MSLLGGELGKCGPPPPLRVEAQALWELVCSCKHHGAHPQVRASGAHPGLQVLWLVLYVEVPASRLVLCVGVSERQ